TFLSHLHSHAVPYSTVHYHLQCSFEAPSSSAPVRLPSLSGSPAAQAPQLAIVQHFFSVIISMYLFHINFLRIFPSSSTSFQTMLIPYLSSTFSMVFKVFSFVGRGGLLESLDSLRRSSARMR